jgi:putative methyltransferase (TIGR04325 family)
MFSGPIWEGVYNSFSEAPSSGLGFSGFEWIWRQTEKIPTIYSEPPNIILASIVKKICHDKGGITILDFGGGLGLTYLQLSQLFHQKDIIEYHIIDNEKIKLEGQKIFGEHMKLLYFQTDIPNKQFDIIHMNSSLHYVENWTQLIKQLFLLKHKFLIITDAPIGNIPTFVTTQNLYDSKVPVWFLNIKEFVSFMKKTRYILAHHSPNISSILNMKQYLPMQNFEKKYQLEKTSNFVFIKNI